MPEGKDHQHTGYAGWILALFIVLIISWFVIAIGIRIVDDHVSRHDAVLCEHYKVSCPPEPEPAFTQSQIHALQTVVAGQGAQKP